MAIDIFKKQYCLLNEKSTLLSDWESIQINVDLYLYYKELQHEIASFSGFSVYLLGYFFNPLEKNMRTLESLLEGIKSIEDILNAFKPVCGRYIVIVVKNSDIYCFTDALSLRNLYYSDQINCIVRMASDINLFKYLLPNLKYTNDAELLSFYENDFKKIGKGNAWVTDKTLYDGVFKLLPNHLLNLTSIKTKRYWPNKKIHETPLHLAGKELASYIESVLEEASKVSKLSIAITAGYDSRLVAAASKKIRESVHYFIDKVGDMSDNDIDIQIGTRVAEILGVEYNINDLNAVSGSQVPKNFSEAYFASVFYAGSRRLNQVYNYYQNYQNYLNVCGVGEIGRNRFGSARLGITGAKLAYKYGYSNNKFVQKCADEWLNTSLKSCNEFNINPYTLYYWEVDLGNWGSVGNSESDIAIEEFNPFNSHFLLEMMISVNDKDTNNVENNLFNYAISSLDNNLSNIPINPPKSRKEVMLRKLKVSKFYGFIDHVRFKFSQIIGDYL